ncbi:hypothetical protein VTN77DRAFT_929 [Rasamsonia byssochlamydoides]|uniref:uncharacterized protein n=1 Tax=Rasamsonia byssochlamydoides TaxID=89139 RepID=UPI003743BC57
MSLQSIVIVVLMGSIAWSFYFYTELDKHEPFPDRISDPNICRLLIAGRPLGANKRNQLPPLLSRALPNQRLRIAFGIDNAFTSDDKGHVVHFVSRAKHLINLSSAEWISLSRFVQCASRDLLDCLRTDDSPEIRVKLTSVIQVVSLRAVLRILFELGKDDEVRENGVVGDSHPLLMLAEAINNVWIASKRGNAVPRFEENYDLQESLRAVFPGHNILTPRENPLNLILPAFETLWRITLRTFIETRFATGRHHPEWQAILVAFAQTPTEEQFKLRSTGDGNISAEFLVLEALRLYPPTRRVHRAYRWSTLDKHVDIAADLEACHTAADIWGSNSTAFNPGRWNNMTREQRNAFLPFGSTPFICPASSVFGPRMIALLVGALCSEMQGDWKLESNEGEVMKDLVSGKRLSAEREAYGEVFLVGKRDRM